MDQQRRKGIRGWQDQFQEKCQEEENPGKGVVVTKGYIPGEAERIMGMEEGMMQLKQGRMGCLGRQQEKQVYCMEHEQTDVGNCYENYYESRGNGSSEIGEWMRCRHVTLGHDKIVLNIEYLQEYLKWGWLGRFEKHTFSYKGEKRGQMFEGWRQRLMEERVGDVVQCTLYIYCGLNWFRPTKRMILDLQLLLVIVYNTFT